MAHPVRLRVDDDLRRNRGTVFFRLLLAIPHLIVLMLWGVATYVAVIVNWLVLLARGTPWTAAHAFTTRYVRYSAQLSAYLVLLAEPYPRFGGSADYPVDVELPAPARQNRWTVLFRLPLAIPALLIVGMLTSGAVNFSSDSSSASVSQVGGLLVLVAIFGWFASLALGRMPRGLRDAGVYVIAYAAQVNAYLLLLTDRYPDSDPLAALDDLPADDHPLRLVVEDDLRRSRVTTFFRLVLAIPHLIWLGLWGIAAFVVMVVNWFAVLITGRSPDVMHGFLGEYLRYTTQVYAYVALAADPYPPFGPETDGYVVDLVVADSAPQDRLTVLFRLPLALPALVISGAYFGLASVAAVLGWFAVLATGRMPRGLRNAVALALRYNAQLYGYAFVLTDRYPHSGPVSDSPAPAEEPVRFLPPDAYATA